MAITHIPAVGALVLTRLLTRAIGRHSGAAGTSRRHAYRNARARTPRPRPGARHQGWPGRPTRYRCARGRPCRRFQPARRRRAARLHSGQAAPLRARSAGGSRAIGAIAIPTGRQAVADRVDRPRRLGWVRLGAGARGRGPEPADPRAAAQCLALRGPTVRPQPDRTRGASLVTHDWREPARGLAALGRQAFSAPVTHGRERPALRNRERAF